MNSRSYSSPIEILLIEDNPDDAQLIVETFRACDSRHKLHITRDGAEALSFLSQIGRNKEQNVETRYPDLILLDLKLPKMNGVELLSMIKSEPALKQIPIIILSASEAERDILASYDMHANCFITKPVDPDQLIIVIQSIAHFWLATAELPGRY